MTDYKLVPIDPAPEMVEAAEDAYMPFGDMELAIRLALLAAPAVQGEPVGYVRPHHLEMLRSGKACGVTMEDRPDERNGVTVPLYTDPQPAEQQPAPHTRIGRTVSLDVSTGEHDAFHRLFGTVAGVEGQDGIILCELDDDNEDKQPAPDVAGLIVLLERAQCPNCDGS